jgi:hypothetical protein
MEKLGGLLWVGYCDRLKPLADYRTLMVVTVAVSSFVVK